MKYTLEIQGFSGPMEKLLALVEERKLEITDVSLAAVTDDFVKYLRTLEAVPAPLLADFIMVASRLILIKSKSLLPGLELTPEEEADIADLELRLARYREFKPAMKHITALWLARHRSYGRPYLLIQYFLRREALLGNEAGDHFIYASPSLTPDALRAAMERLAHIFEAAIPRADAVREKIVSIEEKIEEILGRFASATRESFKGFVADRPRAEIVAVFLALLHLAREQRISIDQQDSFSDILISRGAETRGAHEKPLT